MMKMFRALALSLLVYAAAFAPRAEAQNAALMPMPRLQFTDSSGAPLAGGYLYTCSAGQSCTPSFIGDPPVNPLATFTDSTGSVANANPIVLDSAGRAGVWLGSGTYKLVLQDANGVTQWSQDNVSSLSLKSVTTSSGAVSNFNVPGTLTVGGTISGKLRDFVSVKDYGAKMDGTTDDSVALQSCISSTGSTCYVPTGTLKFGTTISLPLNSAGATHLLCASRNSVLKFTGSGDALAMLGNGSGSYMGLSIENCSLDGTSATSGSKGIHLKFFQGAQLINVRTHNFAGGDGLLLEGSNTLTAINFESYNNAIGIHSKGIAGSASSNANRFYGGLIAYNTKWGVYEDATAVAGSPNENNSYENMVFEPNGTASVTSGMMYLQTCIKCLVSGNYFEFVGATSIPYNVVIGGSTTDGIGNINGNVAQLKITDNFFGSIGQPTIKIAGGALGVTITDNDDVGTPTYFLDIGTSGTVTNGLTAQRNRALSATGGYLTGTDAAGNLVTDGVASGIQNAMIPSSYGMGFTSIASSTSNTPVTLRGNGNDIAAFKNSSGSTVAGITNGGLLTFPAGFSGWSQDTASMKYIKLASCTTAAVQFATCDTVWTFTTAFADTNFTTVCSPGGNGGGIVTVVDQPSRTASSVTVRIANYGNNAAASFTSLACVAFHP